MKVSVTSHETFEIQSLPRWMMLAIIGDESGAKQELKKFDHGAIINKLSDHVALNIIQDLRSHVTKHPSYIEPTIGE